MKRTSASIGIDYKFAPRYKLAGAVKDARGFSRFASNIGESSLLTDEQGRVTCADVQAILSKYVDADVLIFYYAGHGQQVADISGDEADGRDEAMVLNAPQGVGVQALIDDKIYEIINRTFKPHQTIYFVIDACHSATMLDLKINADGPKIVCLSACRDSQCAGETSSGGLFTSTLLELLNSRYKAGQKGVTIDEIQRHVNGRYSGVQYMTVTSSVNIDPTRVTFGQPLRLA